ncbi:uracil phosphoribosyltransferase-domain-containing protein [Xylaria sp. FL1777]|nr:uracil phosphoribosyltransferase-domain-containing protein [Xylaria sp. FL1777]
MLHNKMAKASSTHITPVIVGIYGIPGSGKTHLLHELEQRLGQENCKFYEGSHVIGSIVPGGLDEFRTSSEDGKSMWRQRAIEAIREDCVKSGKLGVVTGHFMFWPEGKETGQPVHTSRDWSTYTHILYLNVAAELISQRRQDDQRSRPEVSVNHLRKWQDTEMEEMRQLCRNHHILFFALSIQGTLVDMASQLLHDFQRHTEAYNLSCAKTRLDEILGTNTELKTMLVLDADKTLTNDDTGKMFWEAISQTEQGAQQLKSLFGSPLSYTYVAFRQAVLLYEEVANKEEFDVICAIVASKVTIHVDFVSLLQMVAKQSDVGAVVVTCGLRLVWEKVLEKEGLSGMAKVIGGGRIDDEFVVTADVKLALVSHLQDVYHMYVLAFGDSPLDLPMLQKADQAIIVVGEESSRSKSMDAALIKAIEYDGFQARQVLLPTNASPRLDVSKLPLTRIDELEFINSPFWRCRNKAYPRKQVFDATSKAAAKILMTPARDASVKGPSLREAHFRIGQYLATEFLAEVVGLEEYDIPHVQGHGTSGFRLRAEEQTLIVALMRGGEPMAFGVSEVLPSATFLHANGPEDVLKQHLDKRQTVILVDSVINSGNTVAQFTEHIRRLSPIIHIVVVAGVVQSQCILEGSLTNMLADGPNLSIITLRLSDNKFAGKGVTDTGNRLFNTTHLG